MAIAASVLVTTALYYDIQAGSQAADAPAGIDIQEEGAPAGIDIQEEGAPAGIDIQEEGAPAGIDMAKRRERRQGLTSKRRALGRIYGMTQMMTSGQNGAN